MVGMVPSDFVEIGVHPGQVPPAGFDPAPLAGDGRGAFDQARDEGLRFVELAIARIARGEGVEGAFRELEAFLIELLSLVERDPGLELASKDLHRAATMIVGDRRGGLGEVDTRRWRLLMDAARRFRARLDAASPNYPNGPRSS
jgi:hypothetical protein